MQCRWIGSGMIKADNKDYSMNPDKVWRVGYQFAEPPTIVRIPSREWEVIEVVVDQINGL